MKTRTRLAALLAAGSLVMALGAVASAGPPTYGINLTKSANPANVPLAGGTVVYTVSLAATGTGFFGTLIVNDGMAGCTLGAPTGDTDADTNLDPGETWAYTCTVNNVVPGTQNTATVNACHNSSGSCPQADQDATDSDSVTVGEGPDITQPPVTQPPATDPPATDPPATDPPATDPPVTDPPVTDPPGTQGPDATPVATPSFADEVDDTGDADETEPTTDTVFGSGAARPSDRSWMLVVALGLLLASIVVMTPSTKARDERA